MNGSINPVLFHQMNEFLNQFETKLHIISQVQPKAQQYVDLLISLQISKLIALGFSEYILLASSKFKVLTR